LLLEEFLFLRPHASSLRLSSPLWRTVVD